MRRTSLHASNHTLLLLPLLLAACARMPDDATPTPPGSPGPGDGVTFCRIQTEVFDPTCVHCHSGAGAAAGLDLSAANAYAELVNVVSSQALLDLVEPSDSTKSYLYHKLTGTHAEVGGSGGKMPLTGSLTGTQVDLVKQWIDEGATEACDGPPLTPGEPTPTSTPDPNATPTPEAPGGDTFCDVQISIFNATCTGCHAGSAPSAGLDLSTGKSFDALVNVRSSQSSLDRIEPGNAQQSYLYHKVVNTHLAAGGSGSQMPLGGPALDPALVTLLENWIEGGASPDCGSDPTPEPPTPTSEPTATPTPGPTTQVPLCGVQQQIFNPYCIDCHSGTNGPAGLELTSSRAYAELVGVNATQLSSMKRITPNDVNTSYLYRKVMGTHAAAGGSGARMPDGGPYLDANRVALLESWINQGAPEFCEGTGEPPSDDVVVIDRAEGDSDKGDLEVRGHVTPMGDGTYAGEVEVFRDGMNPEGTACTGQSLGTAAVDSGDGQFRFQRSGLGNVPPTICIESEGGGIAESPVEID